MKRVHSGCACRFFTFWRVVFKDNFNAPSSSKRNQRAVTCGYPFCPMVARIATSDFNKSRCVSGNVVIASSNHEHAMRLSVRLLTVSTLCRQRGTFALESVSRRSTGCHSRSCGERLTATRLKKTDPCENVQGSTASLITCRRRAALKDGYTSALIAAANG